MSEMLAETCPEDLVRTFHNPPMESEAELNQVELRVTRSLPLPKDVVEENCGILILHNLSKTKTWRIDRQSFDMENLVLQRTCEEPTPFSLDPAGLIRSSWKLAERFRNSFDVERRSLDSRIQKVTSAPEGRTTSMDELPGKTTEAETAPAIGDAIFSTRSEEKKSSESVAHTAHNSHSSLYMALGALGVVFGDIGTSPLYTLQTILINIPPTRENIIGAISTIFWLLNLAVSLKYVTVIMRADNRGEGGIMALTTLASQSTHTLERPWWKTAVMLIGMLGATLFYGDSVITPAISVLSALEGLVVAAPSLDGKAMPIALGVLIGLFLLQRWGTGTVGKLFGPIMLLWFATLAVTGIEQIVKEPAIFEALNPAKAVVFLNNQQQHGTLLTALGGIVLCVTGGEALYADMGHFGKLPIRLAWFFVVLPCLTCNYLGQGAMLLQDITKLDNPFFYLFPDNVTVPAVVLATLATVIASQAVISGSFSMTSQAIKLGFLPRMTIRHMSSSKQGQIYIPVVNFILLAAVVVVTAAFGKSASLASAYGMSVTMTMAIDGLLTSFVMVRWCWHHSLYWPMAPIMTLMTGLLTVDVLLIAACSLKFVDGAWLPLAVGVFLFILMATWSRGGDLLLKTIQDETPPIGPFISWLAKEEMQRTERTAVFAVMDGGTVPRALLSNLKHNRVQHACNLILTVNFRDVPRVPREEQIELEVLAPCFWKVSVFYGFKEHPEIPDIVSRLPAMGLPVTPTAVSYFLSRSIIVPRESSAKIFAPSMRDMARWRKYLFSIIHRNSTSAVTYYSLPSESVIELGVQVQI